MGDSDPLFWGGRTEDILFLKFFFKIFFHFASLTPPWGTPDSLWVGVGGSPFLPPPPPGGVSQTVPEALKRTLGRIEHVGQSWGLVWLPVKQQPNTLNQKQIAITDPMGSATATPWGRAVTGPRISGLCGRRGSDQDPPLRGNAAGWQPGFLFLKAEGTLDPGGGPA